jgi:hypothetical protein
MKNGISTQILIALFSSLGFLLVTNLAYAQELSNCVEEKTTGTVLVFTNGVFNTNEDARRSFAILKTKFPYQRLDKPAKSNPILHSTMEMGKPSICLKRCCRNSPTVQRCT